MKPFDVVVVGAGVSGCSIAAHLLRADPSLRVAILDRAHVGAGSTSRSTAAFRHQWSIPAHVAFSRYASAEYDALAARGIPVAFRRNGYLFLYADEDAFRAAARRVATQRELGVERVAVLAPDEIADAVPGGDRLDTSLLAGATWGPDDGFLDPLAVAQGYLDEARTAGADYLTSRRVDALDVRTGRIVGVVADGTRIAAGTVVLAAGVWGRGLGAAAGLDLPVRPAKRHLYHSRPVRGVDIARWPLVIGDDGRHLRPSEGNTLLFAWEQRPGPLPTDPGDDVLWRGQDEPDPGYGVRPEEYGFEILAGLARHMPVLAEAVELKRVTCGWYAVTPDHKAILGEDPRCAGLFHATGFSGHGIMHAPATGEVIAARVLGRPSTLVGDVDFDAHFGLGPLLDGSVREPIESMVL